ncbi:class I SAM-dependent methyltransferase [Methylobacterium sp. WL103]|uniref:class I SAM-dependent methyltransferase n=1 Tax=Methylobacterium sp. WL103 TaxID=2603891 RepID=UPI0011CBCCAB|nr:class I SAM-dependent methyltransferase [Methylobacterium sp. WL103]TXN08120.1 class I SAM-dependent methyltransferase [Methylobacterium sp. WL103]
MFDDLMFPGVLGDHWQMMQWERIGLTGVLSRVRPKGALEVGVYHGGSLSLTHQYAGQIIAIDIDPEVRGRFPIPHNVDLRIGPSQTLIPEALADFQARGIPLNFVLIDADHSTSGVKRDLELVLAYQPTEPLVILMHDSGNPDTRRGILAVDWSANPHLHFVDCDFIPGQIIEHAVTETSGEIWGGLGLAYLDPTPRTGAAEIRQSARTSIRCLHHCGPDLTILR